MTCKVWIHSLHGVADSNNCPRIVSNSWGKKHWPGTKDLATAIMCKDLMFVDFLESCLRWDKDARMTPDELMQHSWMIGVRPSSLRHWTHKTTVYGDHSESSLESTTHEHRQFLGESSQPFGSPYGVTGIWVGFGGIKACLECKSSNC